MRTLSILIAAVAVLSLSSTFTATQAATRAEVTSTQSHN
jgi:multisubunit Na+/H+ antiporter MnhG subunit